MKAAGRFLTGIIVVCALALPARAERGIASVYTTAENGAKTASGEIFRDGLLTAAHRTIAFGRRLLVINERNGRSVCVVVNDRGPFIRGRVIDLTRAGARRLQFSGLAHVRLRRGCRH